MESLPKEVVVDHVLKRLQEIYPVAGTPGYELVGSVVPQWYTNENFGGSYTNWPVRGAGRAAATIVAVPQYCN